jgi:hypothetical protein
MNAEQAAAVYTIAAGIIGVAFWLGHLATRIKTLTYEREEIRDALQRIFTKLDVLAEQAAANAEWHRQEDRRNKGE